MDEAAQEREELLATFEKEIEKLNSLNTAREAQMLQEFEDKLKELETDHKRKLEEKDREAKVNDFFFNYLKILFANKRLWHNFNISGTIVLKSSSIISVMAVPRIIVWEVWMLFYLKLQKMMVVIVMMMMNKTNGNCDILHIDDR